MSIPLPIANHDAPPVALQHLDQLWFQVGGTLCNLTCRHCFISCSPHNHDFGFLSLEDICARLREMFIPRNWAKARVDFLLRKIELEGEDAASINEIIVLSKKYKFVTPYTSFLAAPRSLLRPRLIKPGDRPMVLTSQSPQPATSPSPTPGLVPTPPIWRQWWDYLIG